MLSRCAALGLVLSAVAPAAPRFSISFPKERSATPLDGRLLLLLSTDPSAEPRMQINSSVKTQLVFGIDVEALAPGRAAVIDNSAFGYPMRSLAQLPPGDYYVQALLHRYETLNRSDGHTVKLPMDRGEGQYWNLAPGNLYSKSAKISVGGSTSAALSLTEEIPPIPPLKDTKYVRHVRIQSQLLTRFWGAPDVSRRARARAGGLRHAPPGAVPARRLSRPFSNRLRRLPDHAARPHSQARLQRALPRCRLQPNPAGRGVQVLPAVDRAEFSAVSGSRDPTRQSVLRRFLRGQLR